MSKLMMAIAVVAVAGAAPASATIVDFEAQPVGNNPNPLVLPEATFTTAGGFNYIAVAATEWALPLHEPFEPGGLPAGPRRRVRFASREHQLRLRRQQRNRYWR